MPERIEEIDHYKCPVCEGTSSLGSDVWDSREQWLIEYHLWPGEWMCKHPFRLKLYLAIQDND